MREQREVVAALEAAGVFDGLRWAYRSAATKALDRYSADDGDDAGLLGTTRFKLFCDRLDRVFSCGRYTPLPGSAVDHGQLYGELSARDIKAMPRLAADLVRRADLNGSPGWAWQQWRFLLASCGFGQLSRLPWPRKSRTKQRVARQPNPEPPQLTLFDQLAADEVPGLETLLALAEPHGMDTFVVAHSIDPASADMELVIGRARMNSGGGEAWHWYEDLLADSPVPRQRVDESATPTGLDTPVHRES